MRRIYFKILNSSIKSVILFIAVAILVTLSIYFILSSIPGAVPLLPSGGFLRLSVMGITLSAFITAFIVNGKEGIQKIRERIKPRQNHLKYYTAPFIVFILAGLSLLINGHSFMELLYYTFGNAFGFLFSFIVSFLIVGMGEEIGWRGFVLPKLMEKFSPLAATLIIIPIWYGFHLSKIIDWSDSLHYYINLFVGIIALAFLFTLMFIRFKEDVFLIALIHASYNVTVDWLHSFYTDTHLDMDSFGEFWSTFVALLAIVTLAYFMINWRSWKKIRYLIH